jgi:hypothetical protein
MLRGVIGSSVPVTGTWIFDILKQKSLRVVKDASGDMLPADGMLARDQAPVGFGGSFSVRESVESGFAAHHYTHDSQSDILRAHKEQVRHKHSPRSPDRGPIEARRALSSPISVAILSAVSGPRPH